MESYEQARQDVGRGKIAGQDNEKVRQKLMMIVEAAKKIAKK